MLHMHIGVGFCCINPTTQPDPKNKTRIASFHFRHRRVSPAILASSPENKNEKRRLICTADELHRVSVSNSDWKLALWRYLPSPKAPLRNHPLLLLSGVATNAIGYDLSPESSFARYMAAQGFDTWILELRGAGLSTHGDNLKEDEECLKNLSRIDSAVNDGQSSASSGQQLFPAQILGMQERFTATLEGFQKQIEMIVKYDWDFDHYLEEDVPAAVDYMRAQCNPRDGKLLAIGHSMGGILLYAMLSRRCFDGKDSGLASVVTLGSSLDYTPSRSSFKLLLPLVEPAQALNIPVIPVGPLLATVYPLLKHPPQFLSSLNSQISAQDMMDQELFEKLVLNNFCTVPAKLLLQLKTAFQKGGLCNRNGSFFYKDHLRKSNVPVLAVAGDQDLICPPEAVYETVKLIPEELVTYKVFGEPEGPHYGHYDIVAGRLAADELYPCITEFLIHHDKP
ncbi:PREDICTED: uncharacterized protein LOC109343039 isoform X5 [Lupinus angustifolius]|uniref:uncharacterized protein LOC109343039 isoform X5 n=1 Tax=Lupinus angustifolius TaxID=3871 RepID=UPI00092F6072|nr:PREDICTED: uncharacterized protein LOC109343039 isoform X5 [Lupinus angustifolius]